MKIMGAAGAVARPRRARLRVEAAQELCTGRSQIAGCTDHHETPNKGEGAEGASTMWPGATTIQAPTGHAWWITPS